MTTTMLLTVLLRLFWIDPDGWLHYWDCGLSPHAHTIPCPSFVHLNKLSRPSNQFKVCYLSTYQWWMELEVGRLVKCPLPSSSLSVSGRLSFVSWHMVELLSLTRCTEFNGRMLFCIATNSMFVPSQTENAQHHDSGLVVSNQINTSSKSLSC